MARAPDPELRRHWQRLVSLHSSSDLSIAAFCERHQVSTASFYSWRRKLRDDINPAVPKPSSFIAVELAPSLGHPIEVHLPGGVRLDVPIGERGFLMDLVRELTSGHEENAS